MGVSCPGRHTGAVETAQGRLNCLSCRVTMAAMAGVAVAAAVAEVTA
jgi:hypothetical protein